MINLLYVKYWEKHTTYMCLEDVTHYMSLKKTPLLCCLCQLPLCLKTSIKKSMFMCKTESARIVQIGKNRSLHQIAQLRVTEQATWRCFQQSWHQRYHLEEFGEASHSIWKRLWVWQLFLWHQMDSVSFWWQYNRRVKRNSDNKGSVDWIICSGF